MNSTEMKWFVLGFIASYVLKWVMAMLATRNAS